MGNNERLIKYPITFNPPKLPYFLDKFDENGSPIGIFHRITWADLLSNQEINEPFLLNGILRRVTAMGWQGSEMGAVDCHLEKVREDGMCVSGNIVMDTINADGIHNVRSSRGVIPLEAMEQVEFALVISTLESGLEIPILKLLANLPVSTLPLTTLEGESHGTMIPIPSWWFVLKSELVQQ